MDKTLRVLSFTLIKKQQPPVLPQQKVGRCNEKAGFGCQGKLYDSNFYDGSYFRS